MLTRLSLSRSREYMADAGAIELTKNPTAMMRALQKIQKNHRVKWLPEHTGHVVHSSNSFMGLFSTHPPVPLRLAAITETTGTPVPVDTEDETNSIRHDA